MKIGVPTVGDGGVDAAIADHFGRAPVFTVVDTGSDAIETVENRGHHQGGSSPPPVTLAAAGAEVVLAGQIGRGAVTRFEDRGIEVYRGASGTVRDAIAAWEAGDLERVGPGDVHGHGHGEHGHDHDHGDGH